MPASEHQRMRTVIEQWKRASAELDRLHASELQAMTDAEALTIADAILDLADLAPPKEGGSGLVEQQRLFARARR